METTYNGYPKRVLQYLDQRLSLGIRSAECVQPLMEVVGEFVAVHRPAHFY